MDERSVEDAVRSLHVEGKWREIVNLGTNDDNYEGRRLLWVWPSVDDLRWIKSVIFAFKLDGVVSVGCGSGLLEWIIQQYSGCTFVGIEADKNWWLSGYSPPIFLKNIIFIDDENANLVVPKNYGLLFCYFNDGRAFVDYMIDYTGDVVIVIGPDVGKNRSTDPMPFDDKFAELGWKLFQSKKLDNGKDCATVYTRL